MTNTPSPGPSNGPLSGLVVVDLTRILAGPYCTMLLADLGARVIKIERPGLGDDTREVGPFVGTDAEGRTSAYFFSVNRNKESIALDLKAPADREVFEQLIAHADVLVENFRPGVMDKLGYGWSALHARHPRLVLASISGFGQDGPYRELAAYDMVVQAMGGVLSLTGPEGGPPVRVGVSIGDLSAGMFGAIGVQAALLERTRTGLGKHVDVAMLDCQVALLENALARHQVEGKAPGPIGTRHPSITPFAVFQAQGGALVIAAGNDAMFARLCRALDRPDLLADPRYANNAARSRHHAELQAELERTLASQPAEHWITALNADGIACGPVNDTAGVLQDPQVRARGMLVDLPTVQGDRLTVTGCPIKFQGEPGPAFRPAPTLDQHRANILADLAQRRASAS